MASLLACLAAPAAAFVGSCGGSCACALAPKAPPARASYATLFAASTTAAWVIRDRGVRAMFSKLSCACATGEARREARDEGAKVFWRGKSDANADDATTDKHRVNDVKRTQGLDTAHTTRARRGLRRKRCFARRARMRCFSLSRRARRTARNDEATRLTGRIVGIGS